MQEVCNSEDSGLNDALKLARRVENDGVVASCRVPRSALQTSMVCAIFKWLNDDKRVTFDYAVSLVDEWERTPADFERLQSAFYVHFGYDPMCHWHGLS